MTAGADPGWSPYTGEPVGPPVPHTAPAEVDRTCRAAAALCLTPEDLDEIAGAIAAIGVGSGPARPPVTVP